MIRTVLGLTTLTLALCLGSSQGSANGTGPDYPTVEASYGVACVENRADAPIEFKTRWDSASSDWERHALEPGRQVPLSWKYDGQTTSPNLILEFDTDPASEGWQAKTAILARHKASSQECYQGKQYNFIGSKYIELIEKQR